MSEWINKKRLLSWIEVEAHSFDDYKYPDSARKIKHGLNLAKKAIEKGLFDPLPEPPTTPKS